MATIAARFRTDIDIDKAREESSQGGNAAFLRIKQTDSNVILRFLPNMEDGANVILGVSWHYLPQSDGSTACVPCLKMDSKPCKICELDRECQARIGIEKPGIKTRSYKLPSSEYGCGASQRYLVNAMKRGNNDAGEQVWEGPYTLEMQTTLMSLIFGLEWKKTTKTCLVAKANANIFDVFNGFNVVVSGAVAPTHFTAAIVSERTGAHKIEPLFSGPDAAAQLERVADKIVNLNTLITFPAMSVYEDGYNILLNELNNVTGDYEGEVEAEVVSARSVAASRKQAAIPAPATGAHHLLNEEDLWQEPAPAAKGTRAAATRVMLDDDDEV